MRVSLFFFVLCFNSLTAQEYYSKLLQKGVSAELGRSINMVNDSTLIIEFIDHHTQTFEYGWMLADLNGDTLSTFKYNEELLRSDGTNSLIMSGDTVFQLMKHRDSIHHIRVYASTIAGDSLFRRDYDWVREDWKIVYPRILYRNIAGEWLIIGTVAKGGKNYDVFAILCAPNGTEIQRNIIIENFEKDGFGLDLLYAQNVLENDTGYIISIRNLFYEAFASSHILYIDKDLNLLKRQDNATDGLGFDCNPIGFTLDSTRMYFSSSRILDYEEITDAGYDWLAIQNPTMITCLLDPDGNLIWERIMYLPDGNWLEVFQGKTVKNGDFVVSGTWQKDSERLGLIARYSEQGDLIFCYGFPLHHTPNSKALWLIDFVEDSSEALIFMGELLGLQSFNDKDIWLLRIPSYGCDPEYFDCEIDSIISSIKLLPEIPDQKSDMTLYPNPIFPGQAVNLELSGMATGPADLRWIDMQGKVLQYDKIDLYENAPSLQVPAQLGAGWYLLEVRDKNGKMASARVVVWEKL